MRPLTHNSTTNRSQASAHLLCCDQDRYLQDHFPDFPVMPGVVLMEAFRQLVCEWNQEFEQQLEIHGYENFRFRSFVRPCDNVELCIKIEPSQRLAKCFGTVNGKRVVSGNLQLQPSQKNCIYRNAKLPEFLNWNWHSNYQELEFEQLASAELTLPLSCVCEKHIPDPFILEGLAQTGVKMIEQHCPPEHITALVKVPHAAIESRAKCDEKVSLKVKALGVQPQGGIFRGVAVAGDRRVLDVEFMLTFAAYSDSLSTQNQHTRTA